MYISKIRVKNYKSFLDSGDIHFEPGINIITGQNNGGKSALLKALSTQILNMPHLSSLVKPNKYESIVDIQTSISIQYCIAKNDFKECLYRIKENNLIVPHNFDFNEVPGFKSFRDSVIDLSYFGDSMVFIDCTIFQGKIFNAILGKKMNGKERSASGFIIDKLNKNISFKDNSGRSGNLKWLIEIGESIKERSYLFFAERMNVGKCAIGTNTELKSDASNLPEVIHNLQNRPRKFQLYQDYVRKVLPQIHQFSSKNQSDGIVQINLWNDPNADERNDLTISLSECGTGVSQVLAILYVVFTAEFPQVIIIDEPNSFLHPGASRKLIEVLKEFPQHQYIISTHSPETIAAANPNTIHIVRMEYAQSKVESVDIKNAKNQQLYLAEIGVKLSDVFGADNILWVEGPTEEICFKKIIDKTSGLSLQGTAILGVKNTGDFEGKKTAKMAFDVHRKLATSAGLMPSAIGFIFDLEDRGEKEIAEMQKEASSLISESGRGMPVGFLGRRMFENYLLDREAIAAVLNKAGEKEVTIETIDKWIELHKSDPEFKAIKTVGDDWIIKVDAAKLLNKMFSDLTETRISYSKTIHSVALCDWLLENKPDALSEIVDILKGFLQPENAHKAGKGAGAKKA